MLDGLAMRGLPYPDSLDARSVSLARERFGVDADLGGCLLKASWMLIVPVCPRLPR